MYKIIRNTFSFNILYIRISERFVKKINITLFFKKSLIYNLE